MVGFFILKLTFFISLGAFLYNDFEKFNEDVTILIRAIRLSNTCLEIRRYEKNFIMRSDLEDFLTAQKYINEAIEYLAFLQNDLNRRPKPQLVGKIETKLQQYRSAFKALKDKCEVCSEHEIKLLDDSRELLQTLGRELVVLSEDFVIFEQTKLSRFVQHFQIQLIFYLLLLGVFTISISLMIFKTLIRPLKMIEVAATTIAKNRFTPLPLPEKKDELHSVLRAFNKMVKEIEEQQEQLFQAKKLSSIGTLASGTAHQLNNPLNNISTSCQIALSELKEGDCQFIEGLLKNIEKETHRASETVKGLLEFSRAQTFSIQPAFLDDVVERALRLVSSDVPADISIKKEIPADLAVKVDIQKMTEALLNLLLNSLQAIPEPPGTITITAAADAENKNAVITIEDTGAGIDENSIQKIFDPFYTTKNVGKGTGLGLAGVYGIIKKHSGTIKVESKVGQGTKIIIKVPLAFEKPKSLES